MSQWLARRSAWQFLLIMWPFFATAALLGIITDLWFGHGPRAHLTGTTEMVVPEVQAGADGTSLMPAKTA